MSSTDIIGLIGFALMIPWCIVGGYGWWRTRSVANPDKGGTDG